MYKTAFELGYFCGLKKQAIGPVGVSALVGGGLGGVLGILAEDPNRSPLEEQYKIVEETDDQGRVRKKLVPRTPFEKIPGWAKGIAIGSGLGAGWGTLVNSAAQERLKGK